jgi:hypothetical protein
MHMVISGCCKTMRTSLLRCLRLHGGQSIEQAAVMRIRV